MKKILFTIFLFLTLACSNSTANTTSVSNTNPEDDLCFTDNIEIFDKDFIHENTGISFKYPNYWEFYFDHNLGSQMLTDSCAEIIIYKFEENITSENIDDYISKKYESQLSNMNKKTLNLSSISEYKSKGYLIEINDNPNNYYYNDILIAQNGIGLFQIRIQLETKYKELYKSVINNINGSIKMPTETFSFIKEEPESRQIMQDYSINSIQELCDSEILDDHSNFNKEILNINNNISIYIPYICNSYTNKINVSYSNLKDQKINRSLFDRIDENENHQIHVIYSVPLDEVDNEFDINESGQKLIQTLNINNNLPFDLYNEAYDISFVRLPLKTSELESKINEPSTKPFEIISTYINRIGFNHPKKIYIILLDSPMSCGNNSCNTSYDWVKSRNNVIAVWINSEKSQNSSSIILNKESIINNINTALTQSKSLFSGDKDYQNSLPPHWDYNEQCIMLGKTDGEKIYKKYFNNFKLKDTIEKIKNDNFMYKLETSNSLKIIYFGNLIVKENKTWCVKN